MLQRRQFLKVVAALGLSHLSTNQVSANSLNARYHGKVLIIGAGPAGMSVAHLLQQQGIDYQVFEAASRCGGRTKTDKEFVDFPIPLGAEWLHSKSDTLEQIVNNEKVKVDIGRLAYDPESSYGLYRDGDIQFWPSGKVADLKFVGETWLTFFEKYIFQGIKHNVRLDTEIVSIDYSLDNVRLLDAKGGEYEGASVVVTVPPKVIKDKRLLFTPELPSRKRKAFDKANIWTGFKAFFVFKEKFYPIFLDIGGANTSEGQKMFYDAAYGQNSSFNVLGLFSVGDQAIPYQGSSEIELRTQVLRELDEMFGDEISKHYVRHISQDWSEEPYINQAYFANSGDWQLPPRMQAPVDGKVFFAGDTYTDGEDWSSVHVAVASAKQAVARIVETF